MKIWKTINNYFVSRILSGRSNVFLISADGRNILVDTGPGRLWNTLERRLKKADIKYIDYLVLTHTHYDHAGNAEKIKNEFGAKVIVHETEAPFLEKGENTMIRGTNKFTGFIVTCILPVFSKVIHYKSCIPDIRTGSSLDPVIAGIRVSIIHTPGHSPGSQCVIVDDEIALVGDTMFGIFRESVFPPFANDAALMVNSWGKLLETKCNLFIPSHGKSRSRKIAEKEFNRRRKING